MLNENSIFKGTQNFQARSILNICPDSSGGIVSEKLRRIGFFEIIATFNTKKRWKNKEMCW